MTPIFWGGLIRKYIEIRNADNPDLLNQRRENGVLFSSGLIGGEGLMGVGVALWAFNFGKPAGLGLQWPVPLGEIVSLWLFIVLAGLLFWRANTVK
jgi:hypothetical protein